MEIVISFITLSLLEIILGIDNIVLLSILVGKLKSPSKQTIAKVVGLSLALILRIGMLFSLFWLTQLIKPLFQISTHSVSIKDIVMLVGGAFLLYRGWVEVLNLLKEVSKEHNPSAEPEKDKLFQTILEIAFFDFIFALDSIIVAVGIATQIGVMIAANVFAIVIMILLINIITKFLNANPRFKLLGLGFVILIGVSLVFDGLGFHIPKGYMYSAILFSLGMEVLNSMYQKRVTK